MTKQVFTVEKDGFNGVWYPNLAGSKRGVILMLGDSAEDRMAVCGAKWLHENGCHVMAMSPDKKDYGHHNYPLERFDLLVRIMFRAGKQSPKECRETRIDIDKRLRQVFLNWQGEG